MHGETDLIKTTTQAASWATALLGRCCFGGRPLRGNWLKCAHAHRPQSVFNLKCGMAPHEVIFSVGFRLASQTQSEAR
jgi:hypothetical protein